MTDIADVISTNCTCKESRWGFKFSIIDEEEKSSHYDNKNTEIFVFSIQESHSSSLNLFSYVCDSLIFDLDFLYLCIEEKCYCQSSRTYSDSYHCNVHGVHLCCAADRRTLFNPNRWYPPLRGGNSGLFLKHYICKGCKNLGPVMFSFQRSIFFF